MKKLLIALCLLPGMVLAKSGAHLDSAPVDLSDKESLKRGAQTFNNYCMGCHAADYMRYNRIGRDLGMSDEEVMAMISTRDAKGDHTKPGELMKIAMDTDFAKSAFGTKIPGLTVIARARGADWLYTYLRTFYVDETRPTGVNNIVF
ncbi:MAG: cytochrome c1, partial [Gammaproteobacteria bacterium]|nr:cytochrome c1 [Gammaproteobacteria bacterium]